ncbi:exonuclease [Clostridium sp. CAG:964]|nr:exonuclease [Clostridium sp. CAG:964]
MDFVILDLEWNGSYSKKEKKYINEIIEFGAVRINSKMELIDKFSMLIKPQIGKKICGRVKELTHISNEEIEAANNTYNHVIKEFSAFSRGAVILTWGITDIQTLITNNEYYNKTKTIAFLKKYMNLQSYCENCLKREDPSKQMGLSAAAELLNIDFGSDQLHRALDDSLLSWKCFAKVYDPEKIKSFIKPADAEFYNRVCFKNTVITEFNNPLIDKKQFYAVCPVCGRRGRRLNKWQQKNKSFRAAFNCDYCNKKFNGRVQFKLKYEGVQVKHSSHPYVSPEEAKKAAVQKAQAAGI